MALVANAADLALAAYVTGAMAQMAQAAAIAGAAAVAMTGATSQSTAAAVANAQSATYADPASIFSTGTPNTQISYTSTVPDTSGSSTTDAYLRATVVYDATGRGTTTYASQPVATVSSAAMAPLRAALPGQTV